LETFGYIARDLSGERKKGLRRAGSQGEVLTWLRNQSLIPIEVRHVDKWRAAVKEETRMGQGVRVKSADIASFCWQMSIMVEGGVTAAAALDTIARDTDNLRFGQIILEISERMRKGESFSSSVAAYPKTFSRLFCAMILVSETGGSLPAVLHRLGRYYDERDKLARKIRSAMTYPIFAILVTIFILVIIMVYVVPNFKSMFEHFGGELPAFTKAFLAFYDAMATNILLFTGSVGLVVIAFIGYARTEGGHKKLSWLVLSLPLFGKLIAQAFVAMFCRTAGTLLGAGVSIVESLEILSGTTKNDVINSAVLTARERVIEGSSVAEAMASSGFFPNMVSSMITVGEESGSLPKVLDRTADYYDRKVESTITTMMSLLEPAMIVAIGSIVLVIVLALYLPIFSRTGM